MIEYLRKKIPLQIALFFFSVPLIILFCDIIQPRSLLKNALSVATLAGFGLVISLFFIARPNRAVTRHLHISELISWHKVIGYTAALVLLAHPFLLVVPRFFEAGTAPQDALVTIVTTVSSSGIVSGLTAWSLLLVLSLSSFWRENLPLSHRHWRVFHGMTALLCLVSGAYHAISLGRHASTAMISAISILTGAAIYLMVKHYAFPGPRTGKNHE